MALLGTWSSLTNTPTLINGVGTAYDCYTITDSGTQDLGSGSFAYTKDYTIVYLPDGKWHQEKAQYTLELVPQTGGGGGMTNPMTTLGDMISGYTAGAPIRLGIGTAGQYLTVSAGQPAWTTLTIGLITLDGDATSAQTLSIGTTGTDFAIVDNLAGDHKFNLPTASATNRGALSSANWTTFNNKLSSVTGTTNRILVTSGSTTTPVIDIDPGYIGQPSITSLGIITNGTWHSDTIAAIYGGTGQSGYATGNILYASAVNTLAKLTIGSTGQVLTVVGGIPAWTTSSGTTYTASAGVTLTGNNFSLDYTYAGTFTNAIWNGVAVPIANGGTGRTTANSAYNALSPMAGSGDMEYFSSGSTASRLPIGTAAQVLTVVSGLPKWQDSTGLTNPMTTRGDMIYESSGVTAVRLPVGITDQVLTVQSSGLPAWATSTALTNPMTSPGDMIYESSGTTVTRIPKGQPNQVLSMSTAQLPTWTPYTGLIEELDFEDNNSSIAATTYTLSPSAVYGYTIDNVKVICTSGTCTLAIKINGVAITGISAVSVSNVIATGTATALNTVVAGNIVTMVTTSNSSLIDIKARIQTTRT